MRGNLHRDLCNSPHGVVTRSMYDPAGSTPKSRLPCSSDVRSKGLTTHPIPAGKLSLQLPLAGDFWASSQIRWKCTSVRSGPAIAGGGPGSQ